MRELPPQSPGLGARRFLPRPAALRVLDDAGEAHRHDVPRIWLPWIIRERDPVSRAIRRQQMMTGWDQQMGLVMGVLVTAYIVVGKKLGLPHYLMFAGAFAGGGGLAWMMWWSAHRRLEANWDSLGRQWTDAGLGRGRCPVCLYSLRGAATSSEGLAQCAECGAAWRQERIRERDEREQPRWRRLLGVLLAADTRRSMTDDEGRAFAAERLGAIAARTRAGEPEVAAMVRRVRAPSAPARVLAAAAVGVVFFLPAALLLGLAARGSAATLAWVLLVVPMTLAPGAILVGAIMCSDFGLAARVRRRKMLEAGLCPVCANRRLRQLEVGGGAVVCGGAGGCGATWRGGGTAGTAAAGEPRERGADVT